MNIGVTHKGRIRTKSQRNVFGIIVRLIIRLYANLILKFCNLVPKRLRAIYRFYYKHDVRNNRGFTYRLTSELMWRRFERLDLGEVMAEDFFASIDSHDVCWDFGANVGNFTIRFLEKAKFVVAVEANPLNLNDLAYHMQVNAGGADFKILSGAAGGVLNTGGISVPASGYSGIADTITHHERPNDIFVPFLPVDVFNSLEPPTIIKIDVDGAEEDILAFLIEHNFLKSVRLIYIELQDNTQEICKEYLKTAGFSLLRSDGENYLFDKKI